MPGMATPSRLMPSAASIAVLEAWNWNWNVASSTAWCKVSSELGFAAARASDSVWLICASVIVRICVTTV